jgi:hypothetical protein
MTRPRVEARTEILKKEKKEKQKHIQARGEEHDLARQRQDQQSTEIISRPVAQQWRRKQRYPA